MGRGWNVPSDGQQVRRARADEIAPPLSALLRLREAQGLRRRLRLQRGEGLADMLHRDRGIEAADEDQGRVVRSVVSQVVVVERLPVEGGEVLLVPDRAPVIWMHVEREPPPFLVDEEFRL